MTARKGRRTRAQQLTIFPRGGKRDGAGRKPKGERALVSHAKRGRVDRHTPVHVTMHVADGLPSLRAPDAFARVVAALCGASDRPDCRVVHVSVQSTHLHMIVEARDEIALGRSMKGLAVRIARAVNSLWSRSGTVFRDRFHAESLGSPRQVRNALVYVLNNARKHGLHAVGHCDPCSSGDAFDGWLDAPGARIDSADIPITAACRSPESWLLRDGWKRHGLIGLHEVPGERATRRERGSKAKRRGNPLTTATRPRDPSVDAGTAPPRGAY
jgi:hypothetical protein